MIRVALTSVGGAIVVMSALGIWWVAVTPRSALPVGFRLEEFAVYTLIQFAFGAVGLVLAGRRPRNPIGWLLLGTALLSAWLQLSAGYALNAIAAGRPEGLLVAWIYNWSPVAFMVFVIPAIVVFPDGHASTRYGRALLWLMPSLPLALAFVAVRPGPMVNMPSIQNPYALSADDPRAQILLTITFVLGAAMGTLFVLDVVRRLRVASGVLVQQMKWLLWSGALILGTTAAAFAVFSATAAAPSAGSLTYVSRVLFALAVTTLPVALGVAMLRYRLYDIDVLIKRTLVYGALSAVLLGAYAAFVILLGSLLRPFTGGSEIAVAASTLAVVALVQPLRGRIQAAVDRRFYRSRYNAARTLDAFTSRLRDEVDLDSVRGEMLGVVGETMHPAHASVWLSDRSRIASLTGPSSPARVSKLPAPGS